MYKERYAEALKAIDELLMGDKDVILVAVEGRCASGKTTFAQYLQQQYGCNLFHMDDFFPQAYQRTEERMNEPGGNVDRERFKEEVLKPVLNHQNVVYRAFDCHTMDFREAVLKPFTRLNVVEGAYSQHPYFGDVYDLKIFMDISPEEQLDNLRRRDPASVEVFVNKWIPREEAYFRMFDIMEGNLIVDWDKNILPVESDNTGE